MKIIYDMHKNISGTRRLFKKQITMPRSRRLKVEYLMSKCQKLRLNGNQKDYLMRVLNLHRCLIILILIQEKNTLIMLENK